MREAIFKKRTNKNCKAIGILSVCILTKYEFYIGYRVGIITIKRELSLFQLNYLGLKFHDQGVLLLDTTFSGSNWGGNVIMDEKGLIFI